MNTDLLKGRRFTTLSVALAAVIVSVSFLALAERASAVPTLPAPTILTGPLEGSTLNTDSASFVFDYLDPITGGNLSGYLCSIDGAPAVACNGSFDLVGLDAGAHTFGVRATLTLLGGTPICVLGICIDPGPISVDTDLATRTFSVDVGETSVGTPGSNGSNGSSGSGGSTTTAGTTNSAFAIAMKRYLKKSAQCRKIKRSIHKYKGHKNRMKAHKRYRSCLKAQKKLRAAAMAAA
jgi:hypothetical protein